MTIKTWIDGAHVRARAVEDGRKSRVQYFPEDSIESNHIRAMRHHCSYFGSGSQVFTIASNPDAPGCVFAAIEPNHMVAYSPSEHA